MLDISRSGRAQSHGWKESYKNYKIWLSYLADTKEREISAEGSGVMASVFKRLIRKELGVNSYNKYFAYIQKNIKNKSLESKDVYEDIYEKLKIGAL